MDQYIGKMLDNRYEVLDVIGIGGMAMVYKAYCHRLHRFVAIKILRRDFAADSDFRRRFHDEAQAVAMLSHPNIVSVYDISRNDDLDYIVMELIDGITLKQYMKKKNETLGWREALHYITQIMRALSHAHSRGIIHRDIKPQNIMVLRDGSVRVADFGIARVMSAAQNTLTQETLGSVHYISPEQARGSSIDERADIYSAGVVLYEMLTGRLPFEGDSPVSVAIQHISAIPLSPRDLSPDIPEALEVITLKAMASKIERRYRNAEEMIRDLEEFRKNPNINFDYEHQQDLVMQAAEEPTQVIDTASFSKRRPVVKPPSQLQKDAYDYEVYDDFRETTGRRGIAKRESKLNLIPVISVVILFLLGVGIFVWVLLIKPITQSPESITIPSFLGKTLDELNADSEYQKLFTFIEAKTKPSNEYELGQVMSQEPKPNSSKKLAEGSKIEIALTISSGQEMVVMVDLTNMPHQEALLKIQEMGLEAVSSDYGKSDEIVRGNVISHIPLEGERVQAGTKVKLTLSEGPEVKQVVMPTLIDQTEVRARKMLEDLKLTCKIDYYEDSKAAGIVFYQSVPSAQTVDEGSVVTLHVSSGPSVPVTPNPDSGGTTPELGGRKSIDILLPTDRENVIVKVTVDGEVKFEVPVNTANNTKLTREIDGVGNQTVRVFIDGQLQEEYDLDFSR